MPKNHFKDRPVFSHYPNCILPGDKVQIIEKHLQGTRSYEDLTKGIVLRVLSRGKYYENGVKVEIILWDEAWSLQEQRTLIETLQETIPLDCEEWRQHYHTRIGRIQYFF